MVAEHPRTARRLADFYALRCALLHGDREAELAARWRLVMSVQSMIWGKIRVLDPDARQTLLHGALIFLAERVHQWYPPRGALTTFITICFRSYIDRHTREHSTLAPIVSCPRNYIPARRMAAAGRHPADISLSLNRSEDVIREWLRLSIVSTDDILPGTDRITIGEALPDPRPLPDALLETRVPALRAALAQLPRRERAILCGQYGIGTPKIPTPELARKHGVSRQRIAQVALDARRVLRHLLHTTEEKTA